MNKKISIKIPRKAQNILNVLEDAGYEAYVVGGCVRDSILAEKNFKRKNIKPSKKEIFSIVDDWDITTSAKPQEVKKLFKHKLITVDTGIQHGTVSLIDRSEDKDCAATEFQVTTYRVDGSYTDGRHPDKITFLKNLKEDLARRDFTINAMAYSPKRGFVDEFGGLEDLETGLIKAVGDPVKRFTEDALRMLRAIRFSAKLGFSIDKETYSAIQKLAPNMSKISKERIRVELEKLLISNNPNNIRMVYDTGLAPYLLDGFEKIKLHKLKCHKNISAAFADFLSKESDLTHQTTLTEISDRERRAVNYSMFEEKSFEKEKRFLKALTCSNQTVKDVEKLLRINMLGEAKTPYDFRLILRTLSIKIKKDEDENKEKDRLAENKRLLSCFEDFVNLKSCSKEYKEMYKEVLKSEPPLQVNDLAITGNDLMEENFKGKEIGLVMSKLLEIVLIDPSKNTKSDLMGYALSARLLEEIVSI